jgi:hypothetical protein
VTDLAAIHLISVDEHDTTPYVFCSTPDDYKRTEVHDPPLVTCVACLLAAAEYGERLAADARARLMEIGAVILVCARCHRAPSRDCQWGRCKADEPRDTIEAPPVEAGRRE